MASLQRPESLLDFSFKRSVPIVLQTEAAECGLACLAMIAAYHGYETDLTTLRHKFSISAHGATLRQIMDTASQLKLSSRPLRLEMAQITELQTPCILHWELKHFVVLKKASKSHITILDPAMGEKDLTIEEASKLFTGVALELTPNSDFEKAEEKQTLSLKHFWSRISGLKRSLINILLLSLLLQFFALLGPYYMQTVVDDVLLRNDKNFLAVLAIGFGILLLIETATTVFRQLVVLNMSTRLNIQMSSNIFHHLIRLPIDYFSKRHMGDVVSRFGSMSTIRELITTGLIAVVIDGLMAVITLTVMFIYNWQLSLLVLGVLFVYGLLRYAFYKPFKNLSQESIVSSAKESSHFMESLRAVQTIKLFEKETDRQSQWQNRLADSMNKGIRIQQWEIGFSTINKLLFGIENILIIFFAATFVIDHAMTVGMLYAFISYKSRFISSTDGLIGKWIEFKMLSLHFDRLSDIVFSEKDAMQKDSLASKALVHQSSFNELEGKIDVDNISFEYSKMDKPVFENLSFTINPGETIAFVGPSGGGKSTLLKCLMGLMSPSQGNILIDGVPLQQQLNYRQQIAGVMQEDQLLSGSITENIACFDSSIDLNRVVLCAHHACVHEDILKLPMQYNTLVGDMGTNLSGGQKQRIILARALYRNPKILFMDEATSNLDTNNEAKINEHIKKLNITRILIAHRPETIRSAERIFALANGEFQEITDQIHPKALKH
ncbi:peptidase domain-containing ABC transporter [Alteromonadaceae bacterium M269]|nr:peptidase domain-containing ABC transporter [Alteromonadaceae bacterium M269]